MAGLRSPELGEVIGERIVDEEPPIPARLFLKFAFS